MNTPLDSDDPKDAWQLRASTTVYNFGVALRELHDSNPWPDQPVLPRAMNHLMPSYGIITLAKQKYEKLSRQPQQICRDMQAATRSGPSGH